MKRFYCSCETKAELFFDSTICLACNRLTGFNDSLDAVVAFDPTDHPGVFSCVEDDLDYRQCDNFVDHNVCNGMVQVLPDTDTDSAAPCLCFACHFNNTIPDLSIPEHLGLWQKLEAAKRRTLYTLSNLGLELPDREQDPVLGLSFEFAADKKADDHFQSELPDQTPVFTGHDSGVITINIAEADDVARASTRADLNERYRTLLGHFRHEIGHYFWDRLIPDDLELHKGFRELFGDESRDYQKEMERHYQEGPPANWQDSYISAYATMHPWEDWAETWAHYLHMIDTLETAQSYGVQLEVSPVAPPVTELELPQETVNASGIAWARQRDTDAILNSWVQFSITLNALNRSMGLEDAYPFVLTPRIRDKLSFIHHMICKQGG